MNTPFDPQEPRRPGLLAGLRSSFLTGLIVIAPVAVTIWLIWTVIGWIEDGFVWRLVPDAWQPEAIVNYFLGNPAQIENASGQMVDNEKWVKVNIRGVGVVFFLVFTVFVGWIAKGYLGRELIRFGESLVERTPVVRSIYSGIKQISETVFADSDRNFEKACLVEYPRKGIWAVGFISTQARGEVAEKAGEAHEMLSVFVPTTPNPTSGFLLFFPKEDVIELDMSLEDAAKLVISAGLVYPNGKPAGS